MSTNNPQRDYDQALELKLAGNQAFKSGDLKLALKKYTRMFMHIGMNPCMNLSEMMSNGGAPPNPDKSSKDPLQHETDLLRLTAFNNIAAVYSKMGKWDLCKEKCTRVLKHDPKNTKALFRRGKAYRKLNLYELARSDLKKVKESSPVSAAAVNNELKQLSRDEKNASKEIHAIYRKNMIEAKRRQMKKKKNKLKKMKFKKTVSEAIDDKVIENKDGSIKHLMKNDTNENLNQNSNDTEYVWDLPSNKNATAPPVVNEVFEDIVINLNPNRNQKNKETKDDENIQEKNLSKDTNADVEIIDKEEPDSQNTTNIGSNDIQPTMF